MNKPMYRLLPEGAHITRRAEWLSWFLEGFAFWKPTTRQGATVSTRGNLYRVELSQKDAAKMRKLMKGMNLCN